MSPESVSVTKVECFYQIASFHRFDISGAEIVEKTGTVFSGDFDHVKAMIEAEPLPCLKRLIFVDLSLSKHNSLAKG